MYHIGDNMKLLIYLLLFLTIPILSQTDVSDSTRLKVYENYLLQVDTKIKDTETQIIELQKYLLQLQGAKSAFEAVIAEEKKYLEKKK
jgi:hypothetical protein